LPRLPAEAIDPGMPGQVPRFEARVLAVVTNLLLGQTRYPDPSHLRH
jgi:hypothetical protein